MDEPEVTPAPEAADEVEQTPVEEAPAEEPASEEPDVEEAPAEEAPAEEPAQLSLDEMVEELAEPSAAEDVPEVEAPAAEGVDAGSGATAEPEPPAPEAETSPLPARARLAARLPFWILGGAWAIFAGAMTYLLWPLSTAPFTGNVYYAILTFGGAGLTLAGPLLALAVWLLLRRSSEPVLREGLARAVFLRAAVATLTGNVVWWAALVALDLHRAGVIG